MKDDNCMINVHWLIHETDNNNYDDHDHYDNDNADEQPVENDDDDNHQDQHDKQVVVPIWHGRHHVFLN